VFVSHHRIVVDAILTSRVHGKTKPHETIFRAMLEKLAVAPATAVMVGDDPEDDIAGARSVGIEAWLVDREGRFPDHSHRLTDLRALPAALGLVRESG
jgi:FMN phosphatase YigB (HAD superfamily)